ncbi:MAG TPA: IPT/TIG domain-containing protein [Candidatus Baltobacteraceae bacterium]|nr:IPT/TIG domain-containing protein [Candidatus Baltobacteraceae bacterium]
MALQTAQTTVGGRQDLGEKVADSRLHVVLVEAFYLCILLAVAGLYLTGKLTLPTLIVDFPVGVIWFGALGAVLISLTGAVEHRQDWDPSWNSWHYTRPLIGAALAVVSWLIFQAGILAVGSAPPGASGGAPTNPGAPTNLLYYLIAFVVGYREETFRDLIKRVADVILTPKTAPTASAQPTLTGIKPSTGRAGGGDIVVITGTGFTSTTGVKFGDVVASSFSVNNDGQITATTPQGSAGTVRVSVTTKGGSASSDFTYT